MWISGRKRLQRKINEKLDVIRCRIDMDESLLDQYLEAREYEGFQKPFTEENPLISVIITTYNRSKLLTERSIPSVLNQTWKNLELIVVGDCCQDDTEERISKITDARLRFINLEERGTYPRDPKLRWMVAGIKPTNHALKIVSGSFITHLDDDDRYAPDRLEKLIQFAQSNRLEFIWHPFYWEKKQGKWQVRPAMEFRTGEMTSSSVFYHSWLKRIKPDINAYRLKEPGDWNRFRKFKYLGVKAARYPEPLLYHYMEKQQQNHDCNSA